MNTTSCNDNDFGPAVHGCRDDFDFTLLFENTILSIAPSLLVLLFAIGRLYYLRRKPKLLWARQFQLSKLVGDDPLTHTEPAIYQQEDSFILLCGGADRLDHAMGSSAGLTIVVFHHGGRIIASQCLRFLFAFLSRTRSKQTTINDIACVSTLLNHV
jgi:hypothetical protein